MDLGLKDVPAAVAAASSGLGHAIALELSREGARVAICSRDEARIAKAAESISTETGGEVHPFVADVATTDGGEGFIADAADALGGLQVLVINAGGPPPGPPSAFDEQAWLDALNLNFLSSVRMSLASLPHLRQRDWGRIVAVTSNSVKQPLVGLALSSAARAAGTAFAKTLADEVGSEAITVNTVMPGQIVTDRLRSLAGAPPEAGPTDPAFASMIEKIPAGRVGTPQEFAAAVAFLCSERASFINGISLAVDGGFLRGIV